MNNRGRKVTFDLTGQRFGKLVVVEKGGPRHWKCQCDCGKETEASGYHLRIGKRKSCGCLKTNDLYPDLRAMHGPNRRIEAMKIGICYICLKNRSMEGRTRCESCVDHYHQVRKDRVAKALIQGIRLCKQCTKVEAMPGHSHCAKCMATIRKGRSHRRARIRDTVFEAYGNKCACCGETEQAFLTIDHVNNDGAAHRKSIGKKICLWLKRKGFPASFRLLCYNCNLGRDKCEGKICPHVSRQLVLLDGAGI